MVLLPIYFIIAECKSKSIQFYWSNSHVSANPTCACTKSKFSLDGTGGASFYQQHQSVCCLCLGDAWVLLTYQNPNMVQPEPNYSSVCKSIIIVATRNKIATVYLWPLYLPCCISAKYQHTKAGFKLWLHNSSKSSISCKIHLTNTF